MGWDARRGSAFQPAGAFFFLPLAASCLIPGFTGLLLPCLGFSGSYPLDFFTRFIYLRFHSPYSFCRWDNDVFILHTTRCPAPF